MSQNTTQLERVRSATSFLAELFHAIECRGVRVVQVDIPQSHRQEIAQVLYEGTDGDYLWVARVHWVEGDVATVYAENGLFKSVVWGTGVDSETLPVSEDTPKRIQAKILQLEELLAQLKGLLEQDRWKTEPIPDLRD